MPNLTTSSNVSKFIEKNITGKISKWEESLLKGELHGFEKSLAESLLEVQNFISQELLSQASEQVYRTLVEGAKKAGIDKLEKRKYSFKISTGHRVEVVSPYDKCGKNNEENRQLLTGYWNIIGRSSPYLYDKVAYCAALSPSYDVAHQTLNKFGVALPLSSVRDITNHLANYCFDYGEQELMLAEEETLENKRVVISIDGGRTRTRVYDGKVNDSGHNTYETAWREPKLFVIDILDEEGNSDKKELPIYGCRFSEDNVLDLLGLYLKKLQIQKAREVQIIADGATWIWNRMKPLLLNLDVKPERITETLDYYHASEYVHGLIAKMPKRISEKQKKTYLKQFKEWLWQANSAKIVEECKAIYKRPCKLVKRWINYLDRHQEKMQYAVYKESKLICGSGIIESGIRRIINLRFKNASTFWYKETVEKLYFFREALLSKRWEIVINNITT